MIKIINLLTFSAGGNGYMTFMGNEFGHPEWIDFPREGNGWSYYYARRQWSLADNEELRYSRLLAFTTDMIYECKDTFKQEWPELMHCHDDDKVISYKRGNLQYVISLNPSESFVDYGIPADSGKWIMVLNSDSEDYDGHGRLPEKLEIESKEAPDSISRMNIYLPSRTALVFKKAETQRKY